MATAVREVAEGRGLESAEPHRGRVTVVTDASRGLGATIARRLAEDGGSVALTDANSVGAAETVAAAREAGVENG